MPPRVAADTCDHHPLFQCGAQCSEAHHNGALDGLGSQPGCCAVWVQHDDGGSLAGGDLAGQGTAAGSRPEQLSQRAAQTR